MMVLYINLIYFVIACFFLVISGSFLVRSLLLIGKFLRFSEFVVSFLIMAFSTSIPELLIGISSALNKNSALSLGNVIGANILDLTLVGGLSILVGRNIRMRKKVIKRDSIFVIFVAMLPVILMAIGNQISRLDGAILVFVFFIFNWHVLKHKREFRHASRDHLKKWSVMIAPASFIISLAILFFSSHYVVKYASILALELHLPNILIGLFFVSMGTTLPELTFELRSIKSKHPELAFGDLMGSIVTNSSLVLGVASLIYPITANFFVFLTSAIFMIMVSFLFAAFMQGTKLTTIHGITLVIIYVLFVIIELSLTGVIPSRTVLLT